MSWALGARLLLLLLLLYFRFLRCLVLHWTFLYFIGFPEGASYVLVRLLPRAVFIYAPYFKFLLLPSPFLVTLLGSRFGHAQSSSNGLRREINSSKH